MCSSSAVRIPRGAGQSLGGFVDPDEDLPVAACRELFEETGFAADWLIQIGAYGHPDRDSRGRTISIVYGTRWYGSGDTVPEVEAADDAADARWFPVTALPDEIAFDHRRVLNDALARLDEGELVERLVWRLETTHGAVLRPRGITPY